MGEQAMTLQDKKREIDRINEKLSVMGSRELIIVNTAIAVLYNRQQIEEYEQSLNQQNREPELVGK